MSRALATYVSLPVPDCTWSATEWLALAAATRSPDMDQRWTTEVFDRQFLLKRSGRPVFQASVEVLPDQGRRLVDLGCEGDSETFNRSGFQSDTAVADLFIGAARGLIERYL